jgi:hypothetical protein
MVKKGKPWIGTCCDISLSLFPDASYSLCYVDITMRLASVPDGRQPLNRLPKGREQSLGNGTAMSSLILSIRFPSFWEKLFIGRKAVPSSLDGESCAGRTFGDLTVCNKEAVIRYSLEP